MLSVPKKAWANRVKKCLNFVAVAVVVLKINISSVQKNPSNILTPSPPPHPIHPMDTLSDL